MTAMISDARRVAHALFNTGITNSRIGAQLGRHRSKNQPRRARLREQTITAIAMTAEIGSIGDEVAARLVARLGLTIIPFANLAAQVAAPLGVERRAVLRYVNGRASRHHDNRRCSPPSGTSSIDHTPRGMFDSLFTGISADAAGINATICHHPHPPRSL
jgi:hypothetical protein